MLLVISLDKTHELIFFILLPILMFCGLLYTFEIKTVRSTALILIRFYSFSTNFSSSCDLVMINVKLNANYSSSHNKNTKPCNVSPARRTPPLGKNMNICQYITTPLDQRQGSRSISRTACGISRSMKSHETVFGHFGKSREYP